MAYVALAVHIANILRFTKQLQNRARALRKSDGSSPKRVARHFRTREIMEITHQIDKMY